MDLALHIRGEEHLWFRFDSSAILNEFIDELRQVIGTNNTYRYVLEIGEMVTAQPQTEPSCPLFQIK